MTALEMRALGDLLSEKGYRCVKNTNGYRGARTNTTKRHLFADAFTERVRPGVAAMQTWVLGKGVCAASLCRTFTATKAQHDAGVRTGADYERMIQGGILCAKCLAHAKAGTAREQFKKVRPIYGIYGGAYVTACEGVRRRFATVTLERLASRKVRSIDPDPHGVVGYIPMMLGRGRG